MTVTELPERGFHVRALGEVAIRCADLDAMRRFYRDVIGLEIYAERFERQIVFFRIGDGFQGHTTVLALFSSEIEQDEAHRTPVTGGRSALHHLALTVGYEEQDRAIAWYEALGQPYRIENFEWTGWRGVFTTDPEGNTVELVAATGKGPSA
jgi:catechol 2,3-dioxygenase-like lactoylglutathione lyase family enzyme